MTVNKPNRRVLVQINSQGIGRQVVDFPPQTIEVVRVCDPFGTPHVLDHTDPTKAWIQVLGAEPDLEVTVVFYAE